jgi:hypothetical protein
VRSCAALAMPRRELAPPGIVPPLASRPDEYHAVDLNRGGGDSAVRVDDEEVVALAEAAAARLYPE